MTTNKDALDALNEIEMYIARYSTTEDERLLRSYRLATIRGAIENRYDPPPRSDAILGIIFFALFMSVFATIAKFFAN